VYQGSIGSLTSCDTTQPHGRSFTYDSLSRLISATNPESGTVSYTYDAVGNLATRKDARGITTSYTYDALNRLTGTSYTDGTPAVAYTYDQGGSSVNAIGHLTQVDNSRSGFTSVTNYTSFDALGEVTASNQQTFGQTFNFAYSYSLAGA
jgi:YD repeat-containing protein